MHRHTAAGASSKLGCRLLGNQTRRSTGSKHPLNCTTQASTEWTVYSPQRTEFQGVHVHVHVAISRTAQHCHVHYVYVYVSIHAVGLYHCPVPLLHVFILPFVMSDAVQSSVRSYTMMHMHEHVHVSSLVCVCGNCVAIVFVRTRWATGGRLWPCGPRGRARGIARTDLPRA